MKTYLIIVYGITVNWVQKTFTFMVSDTVNTEGILLSLSEVKEMYSLNINVLNYFTVK